MEEPILIEQYNPKKIVLGKVDEKFLKFFYPSKVEGDFEKIRFQIPSMKIPFDIEQKDNKAGTIFVKNISLSTNEIGSRNNRKRIEILRTKIMSTEKYIKKLLPEHFKDKNFYSSLWQGKSNNYKPIFKVSMGFDKEGRCTTGVFDEENNAIDHNEIKRGQLVSMVIFLDKVWVYNDKMGINWVVEQVKINNPKSNEEIENDEEDNRKVTIKKFAIRDDN